MSAVLNLMKAQPNLVGTEWGGTGCMIGLFGLAVLMGVSMCVGDLGMSIGCIRDM